MPARCLWVVMWAFSPFLSMSVAAHIEWHFLYVSVQRITRNRLHAPMGIPGSSAGKESACNAGDLSSIPGLGRSPEEGKGYPLQYSSLENSMDCIAYGVAKSQTWLSDFHFKEVSKIKCGKFWKRWEYQTTWPASWETYMQVRKQQLELSMEQQIGSK